MSRNPSILSLACLFLGFLVCTFLPRFDAVRNRFSSAASDCDDINRRIFFQFYMGVFFYGFVPVLATFGSGQKLADLGLSLSRSGFSLVSGAAAGALLILINFLNRHLQKVRVMLKVNWKTELCGN